MDIGDLFRLARHLDPRRRKEPQPLDERPPVVMRMPSDGEGVPLDAAVRPRTVTPPEPVAPAVMTTQNVPQLVTPDLNPASIDPRVYPSYVEPPPLPQKQVGIVGMDVDPRTAGMDTRPRVANPMEYRANRVAEMSAEPEARDENGWFKSGLKRGALGLLSLNPFTAAREFAAGAINPAWDERRDQQNALAREQGVLGRIVQARKAVADVEGDEVANQYKAAQIPYLLAKPDIEQYKAENTAAYQQATLAERRRANESLEDYRNRTLGQKKDAAESLEEYRDRMIKLGEQRVAETVRSHKANEALGGERNSLIREGLKLRQYLGEGNLDATWARVSQGYDRLGSAQQKQVDTLAEKAAKAKAEADYFAGQPGREAEAKLKQAEAEGYRSQAEAIQNRPAPRVARPEPSRPAAPPISEEDFVTHARQEMMRTGRPFDEQKARAAYRARYQR
jgi:hypothetical protein